MNKRGYLIFDIGNYILYNVGRERDCTRMHNGGKSFK